MIWRFLTLRHKTIALLAIFAAVAACAPSHVVRPLPDFVDVAIQPGDTVIVTTHARETVELVVTEVTEKSIHSADREIELIDIAELRKVAWERPPSPCGGDEPLGCSVPLLVSVASEEHAHYREKFFAACAQHDYCYRHGYQTYGLQREYCDEEFLLNMQNSCPSSSDSTLGSILEALNDSVDSRTTCLLIASDFHVAARDFGGKYFQSNSSSYCEYDGPP